MATRRPRWLREVALRPAKWSRARGHGGLRAVRRGRGMSYFVVFVVSSTYLLASNACRRAFSACVRAPINKCLSRMPPEGHIGFLQHPHAAVPLAIPGNTRCFRRPWRRNELCVARRVCDHYDEAPSSVAPSKASLWVERCAGSRARGRGQLGLVVLQVAKAVAATGPAATAVSPWAGGQCLSRAHKDKRLNILVYAMPVMQHLKQLILDHQPETSDDFAAGTRQVALWAADSSGWRGSGRNRMGGATPYWATSIGGCMSSLPWPPPPHRHRSGTSRRCASRLSSGPRRVSSTRAREPSRR